MSVENKKYHVAVYGTLKRGYGLSPSLLDNGATFVGNDVIKGMLLHLGAYPALVLNCGTLDREVPVEVYEVDTYCLNVLDAVEGVPTLYTRAKVETSFGPTFVYVQPASRYMGKSVQLIPSGGWQGRETLVQHVTLKQWDSAKYEQQNKEQQASKDMWHPQVVSI